MFRNLSKNKIIPKGKKVFSNNLPTNKVNFSFGCPEWQQKYISTTKDFYNRKKLIGNREIIEKDYLKPGFSNFELVHFPNKKPFMTSNIRDFKNHNIKQKDIPRLSEERLKFLRESEIQFGDHKQETLSFYGYFYRHPKKAKSRFNYDKVNFTYNKYYVNPITQDLLEKEPKKMNPFDYYNKDKDKHYVSSKFMPFINGEFMKVWDPITNRYFPGSLRFYEKNSRKI